MTKKFKNDKKIKDLQNSDKKTNSIKKSKIPFLEKGVHSKDRSVSPDIKKFSKIGSVKKENI